MQIRCISPYSKSKTICKRETTTASCCTVCAHWCCLDTAKCIYCHLTNCRALGFDKCIWCRGSSPISTLWENISVNILDLSVHQGHASTVHSLFYTLLTNKRQMENPISSGESIGTKRSFNEPIAWRPNSPKQNKTTQKEQIQSKETK